MVRILCAFRSEVQNSRRHNPTRQLYVVCWDSGDSQRKEAYYAQHPAINYGPRSGAARFGFYADGPGIWHRKRDRRLQLRARELAIAIGCACVCFAIAVIAMYMSGAPANACTSSSGLSSLATACCNAINLIQTQCRVSACNLAQLPPSATLIPPLPVAASLQPLRCHPLHHHSSPPHFLRALAIAAESHAQLADTRNADQTLA